MGKVVRLTPPGASWRMSPHSPRVPLTSVPAASEHPCLAPPLPPVPLLYMRMFLGALIGSLTPTASEIWFADSQNVLLSCLFGLHI